MGEFQIFYLYSIKIKNIPQNYVSIIQIILGTWVPEHLHGANITILFDMKVYERNTSIRRLISCQNFKWSMIKTPGVKTTRMLKNRSQAKKITRS